MTALTDDTIPTTPRRIRDEMVAFGLMAVLLAIVPLTGIYPFFVMQALCFALLACAFNLLIGYGGLLSFGHAMFLGTAGYITAHALKVWGLTPELGIVIGTAGAAGLGVITGIVGAANRAGMVPTGTSAAGNSGTEELPPGCIPDDSWTMGALAALPDPGEVGGDPSHFSGFLTIPHGDGAPSFR